MLPQLMHAMLLVHHFIRTFYSPHAYRQKHTESKVFELLSKGTEPKAAQDIIHALALVCFAYISDLLCCGSHIYLHAIQVCVSHLHRLATANILQWKQDNLLSTADTNI